MTRAVTAPLLAIATSLALALASGPARSQPCDTADVFFGNLHSHTSFSDGRGTPRQAYQHARGPGQLDFMAITEHNHRDADGTGDARDGKLIATNPALYPDLLDAAGDREDPGRFAALFGQEFSTISTGNHVNVIGADEVIDDTQVPNGAFDVLYEDWIPLHPQVRLVQWNHPWDGKNEATQYGLDDFSRSHARLRAAAAAAHVRLIEVINGPGTQNLTDAHAQLKGEAHYKRYLERGYRLGPTANQDNHFRTWGTLTGARTGVYARELSRGAILDALRERRVYASTDRNLRVSFRVEGACPGSERSVPDRKLRVAWAIEDEDEPAAPYTVQIVDGSFAASGTQKTRKVADQQGDGSGAVDFQTSHRRAFVYLRLTQHPGRAKSDVVVTSPVWTTAP